MTSFSRPVEKNSSSSKRIPTRISVTIKILSLKSEDIQLKNGFAVMTQVFKALILYIG